MKERRTTNWIWFKSSRLYEYGCYRTKRCQVCSKWTENREARKSYSAVLLDPLIVISYSHQMWLMTKKENNNIKRQVWMRERDKKSILAKKNLREAVKVIWRKFYLLMFMECCSRHISWYLLNNWTPNLLIIRNWSMSNWYWIGPYS